MIPPDTDAFRVVDGDADGYPGIFIDQLADRILLSTREAVIPSRLLDELRMLDAPVYHKRLDRDVKEAPVQIAGPEVPDEFVIEEQGVRFFINMKSGYSQGLFLDQRDNRMRVRQRSGEGSRILNTFAYTGAFSVYAALGGAVTTTLDLAQPCLDWAKRNMDLNGIDPGSQYFCKGDTFHWLDRFARQKRLFDGIVLDPPTFSRNENGRIFRVESHYGHLVRLARECLAPGGWILCTTNCRTLPHPAFRSMVQEAAPDAHPAVLLMPEDFRGENYLKTIWLDF